MVALSAVAALVDSFVLLYIAWGSGAFGPLVGSAGFLGLLMLGSSQSDPERSSPPIANRTMAST
jgi:hypothetical protein